MPFLVQSPVDDVPALVRTVLAEHEKVYQVTLLVRRQSCQMKDAFKHLVAVALALLGVDIENPTLVGRQLCHITENLLSRQGGSDYRRDIECLLAFGLACGCAEVSDGSDGGAVHFDNFRGKLVLFCDRQLEMLQERVVAHLVDALVVEQVGYVIHFSPPFFLVAEDRARSFSIW